MTKRDRSVCSSSGEALMVGGTGRGERLTLEDALSNRDSARS